MDIYKIMLIKKKVPYGVYQLKILKEKKGKNYNTYINELRIEYVINRLSEDRVFRKYTIKI